MCRHKERASQALPMTQHENELGSSKVQKEGGGQRREEVRKERVSLVSSHRATWVMVGVRVSVWAQWNIAVSPVSELPESRNDNLRISAQQHRLTDLKGIVPDSLTLFSFIPSSSQVFTKCISYVGDCVSVDTNIRLTSLLSSNPLCEVVPDT